MVLAGSQAGPEQRVRFLQEAELVARLSHPNIVQVHEVGAHAGCVYLALEYVDGPSLDQKCAGTPQPREAARLVEVLAAAVHEAHQRGIVHRDLKPANVLLTGAGVPKIADFGLARRVEATSGLTWTGAVVGTPAYMAPEQAAGKNREVGPTADVYALGAILYELLTGRPPFLAESPLEMLHRVATEEPMRVRALVPDVPADLETIALKCLEKQPSRRYASAQALAEDLRRFQADEPIAARPVGAAERAWRWVRHNPGWAAMAASTAALLVLIAVSSTLAAVWFAEERRKARLAERDAEEQREAAEVAERGQREKLLESHLSAARAWRFSGRIGQRYRSLEALREAARLARDLGLAARLDEVRDEATACLALPDLRVGKEWPGGPSGSYHLDFDACLERCVRTDPEKNTVTIRRVADDSVLFTVPGAGPSSKVRLTADGRFLAVWVDGDRRFQVWDLAGPRRPFLDTALVPSEGAFSPDSRLLALIQPGGRVGVLDLISGKPLRLLPPTVAGRHLAFDPRASASRWRPNGPCGYSTWGRGSSWWS
jgi:hypothetical protein